VTQPGWYPDGQGNTRYWDGSRWADSPQTATQPAVAAEPETPYQAPPAYSPQPTRRRSSGRMPLWQPIVFGLLILLGGVGLGAAAGKSSTKTVAGPTQTATATVQSTVTATPTVIKTIATKSFTATITYTPPVVTAFTDGEFRVGSEIKPGTYHTDATGKQCYWERDNNGTGIGAVIANDNITGPTTIDILSSDYSFKSSGGCDWTKIG
jgi:hypothetical protein